MAESMAINAARWVVDKALSPLSGGFLKAWAASSGLGRNVDELNMKLLSARVMLDNARGRQIDNPDVTKLLQKLRDLVYDAEDVLDELDYFRIQDELDGTYEAADKHPRGCLHDLALNARHTALSVGSKRKRSSPSSAAAARCGCALPCRCRIGRRNTQDQQDDQQDAGLKFERVQISARMNDIIEQLKPVFDMFPTILELMGPRHSTTQDIANNRPITFQQSIESKLHGREATKKDIIYDITQGKYCDNQLTVLPIVGPGGIGKTTLTHHIYEEVEAHFEVKVWVCVSLNFDVFRLTQEIEKLIPKPTKEEQGTPNKLIEQGLKHKKFLLVLDDMWDCASEDEWKKFLVPFIKAQSKGSIILATTRFLAVAERVKLNCTDPIQLDGLDPKSFWMLFRAYVFGDEKSEQDQRLLKIGEKIVEKLKGNPLAAKTVGRLLKKQLDLDHWTKVLDSKEWQSQRGKDDIMPALKLSYDYLPFHLQQCFTYCALFPEDYIFEKEELIHLWIGLDVIHSNGQNKRYEDLGQSYLNELVDHGFFKEGEKKDGDPCYVIHDLLHELALNVSSYECLSICTSNLPSIQIPLSIRHLSIIIDDTDVKDKKTFEAHKKDLSTLDKRLNVENLHSLMIFGRYHGCFAKIFANLFMEAKALRVILLLQASYNVEDLFYNFSRNVHLRYLRIKKESYSKISLPSSISRLYHLRVLALESYCGNCNIPGNMCNLAKLRHFLVPNVNVHSEIPEVGKLKYLQELKRFVVRKDNDGFALSQLGQLLEIGGSLHICNLENVQVKEAADEARLIMHKNRLRQLTLEWTTRDSPQDEPILENLKPPSNLQKLCIRGHGGTSCPTWLGMNFCTRLESLCLDDVAWMKLPNLGEMWVVDEHGKESPSCITDQSFENLKRLELVKIPSLKKWVPNGTFHLFSHLEKLVIKDCSQLMELPFSYSTCNQPDNGEPDMKCFPMLKRLEIVDCPRLLSLPPIPWKHGLCSARIERVGFGFEKIDYSENYSSELTLTIKGNDGLDGASSWKSVAFHNLVGLKVLEMEKCPALHLGDLQMLKSLKDPTITESSIAFSTANGEGNVGCLLPVESISINQCGASGKELTQLLSNFPKLASLEIENCEKITGLGVVEHEQRRGEDETAAAAAAEEVLVLPPQIQVLFIEGCPELILRTGPSSDDPAGGLQHLYSLRYLHICRCPKFLSSSTSCVPFPKSLQSLGLVGVKSMPTLAPLSNLASLTKLFIRSCGDLRGEGLWPLLAQGHLTRLGVYETPKFFVGTKHEEAPPNFPSVLQELGTDDIAGFLVASSCSFLSSSLTELTFDGNKEVERFAKEQEEALHLLTSLQILLFLKCNKLQCLPAGLHRLTNLKTLSVVYCGAFRSLPEDGLPSSLQELDIRGCPAIRSLPKDGLPSSLQELEISDCPAIRSLPKGGLPSSLRVLDVSRGGNSEELRRQCRKLSGTIPIIRA